MEYLPTWLLPLLIGVAGACLAAITLAAATAVITNIYRRHIRPPSTATVTTSTSAFTPTVSPVRESRGNYTPPSALLLPPPPPPVVDEIECGQCSHVFTGNPAYSKVMDTGALLVYKCPRCQTEVGVKAD